MLRRYGAAMLISSALALGQNPGNPMGGQPSQGSNSNSSGGGNSNSDPNARPRDPMRALLRAGATDSANEPLTGRVMPTDGSDTAAGILVQKVCGPTVQAETRTDSSGRFVLTRATDSKFTLDSSSQASTAAAVWGCELRATASGYQTGTFSLGNGRGEVGEVMILLHRAGVRSGMTVSATTLLAPRSARKAYDKGLEAARHNSPDQAQRSLQEAVRIDPRFAAAWLELGKVYEQRGHREEARGAYAQAIAADAAYLFPYERLYRMDIHESRWKQAADTTAKVLRMDPYEFPQAFYFNAVANLELNQLDAAERSAREAAKLEGPQAEPGANYLLGLVLWRKGDLGGAHQSMQTFLDSSPAGAELASGQRALGQIDRQQARSAAREGASQKNVSSPPGAPSDQ